MPQRHINRDVRHLLKSSYRCLSRDDFEILRRFLDDFKTHNVLRDFIYCETCVIINYTLLSFFGRVFRSSVTNLS